VRSLKALSEMEWAEYWDAEIDRYVASGALVSASLPQAVIANNRQPVSSPVTDIR
jgi:hypothetical protein